jgi:hypothetical protein
MDITGSPTGARLFDDIDYGPDGVLRGVTFDSSQVNSLLYTINTSTGLGTLVGGTGFGMDGLASIPTPEPSAWALLLFGLVGLPIVSSRRYMATLRRRVKRD